MSFESFFASDKFNFKQVITPYKGSKRGLFIYRVIVFIIFCFGLYCSIYNSINTDPKYKRKTFMWASYFTNQTFIGIMIYFFANIVFYCVDKNGKLKGRINNSICHTIVHMFYNALFPLAILVTVIFWGMIFPVLNTSYFNFYHWSGNVIQHLFQSIFLGIDWYLITVPTSVSHAIPMIIVGVAYLIFSQIYHSIYDIWIYPFLDHSNKYWYVIYIALVIAWCIFGVIFSLIQNFKNRKREFVGEENEKNKADIINV